MYKNTAINVTILVYLKLLSVAYRIERKKGEVYGTQSTRPLIYIYSVEATSFYHLTHIHIYPGSSAFCLQ